MDFLIEFDYNAEESDELNLKKGDIVINCKLYEDGWMSGTFKGKNGVFPSNFGKQITTESNKVTVDATDTVSVEEKVKIESKSEDNTSQPAKKILGVGFGNIFQGKQIQLKRVGDSKTQSGENGAKTEINFDKTTAENATSKEELVKVSVSYEPMSSDELHMEEGNIITVIDKKDSENGLWRGKLNGKVGLFPFNFVVAVAPVEDTKPPRPTTAVKTTNPPVLAAKPLKPKTVVARPQSYMPYMHVNKTPQKNEDEEVVEIGFDSPITHKPLVSPTAERVRRQNVRLPKKIGVQNDDDVTVSTKEKSMTLPSKINMSDMETEEKSLHQNPKTTLEVEKAAPYTKTDIQTVKVSNDKEKSDENRSSDKQKEIPVSEPIKTNPVMRGNSMAATAYTKKGVTRPKSQFINPVLLQDDDQTKVSNGANNVDLTKKILAFEMKIFELEKENISLKKEMLEATKGNSDQIKELKTIVNKLLEEVTAEKKKRTMTEEEVSQLKKTVEKLSI